MIGRFEPVLRHETADIFYLPTHIFEAESMGTKLFVGFCKAYGPEELSFKAFEKSFDSYYAAQKMIHTDLIR